METKRIWLTAIIIGIALAAVALLCSVAQADDSAETIYKAKCAMCHGPDGKGDTPAGKAMKVNDLSSGDVQKMSDSDLSAVISGGKGKMPAYKAFTPDQLKGLAAFVRSIGKKK
jgi:mono/diheme cytochrome c family protein